MVLYKYINIYQSLKGGDNMIKKFLKAILLGVTHEGILSLFLGIGWLPTIVMIVGRILNACKITAFNNIIAIVGFFSLFLGLPLYAYIKHCIEAVEYQEENKCSFSEAWRSTEKIDEGTY